MDGSLLWFFGASGVAAVVGGIAGRAGYRWGVALAAGAGLSFLSITALMVWAVLVLSGGSLSVHLGIAMHSLAAIGGLLLATQISASTSSRRSPPLHPLGVVLGVGGAAAWVIGYLVPSADGVDFAQSVTDLGDGWLTAVVVLILAVPGLGGLVLLAERTAAAAMFLLGSMTTVAAAWALSSVPEFQSSGEQFTVFANGQFAWMTASVVAVALASAFPLFRVQGAQLPDGLVLPPRSPTFALTGVMACLVIVGAGLAAIDGDEDEWAFDDSYADDSYDDDLYYDSGSVATSWSDVPYDSTYDPYGQDCEDGDMGACDDLYEMTPPGSSWESFAKTCGGMSSSPIYTGDCVSSFGYGTYGD